MDELRRLRGILTTASSHVDDICINAPTNTAGGLADELLQLRATITAIEPAYEVAMVELERRAETGD